MKTALSSFISTSLLCLIVVDCRIPAGSEAVDSDEAEAEICDELAGSKYMPVTLAELLCVARDPSLSIG